MRQKSFILVAVSDQTVQVPAKGSVAVRVAHGLIVLRGAKGLRAAVTAA